MRQQSAQIVLLMTALLLALGARDAAATAVQDLVRIKGHESATLIGMGIVVGLNGTGDTSKDAFIAARPFAKLLTNLGNPVEAPAELARANAFAIVSVSMRVPPTGVRDGDRLDVTVHKLFNAKSLAGGFLVPSLLRLPGPDSPELTPMAFAEGRLLVDADNPGSGRVRSGGQMIQDIRANPLTPGGTITLVLKDQYAGFPVAATVARAIDDEFAIDGLSNISFVEDAKNIRIQLPEADRTRPADFISALMRIPIDPSLLQTEARIVINEQAGIITVTGSVEIGPVAITHHGLQLSNIAPTAPDEPLPPSGPRRWVGFDTTSGSSRSSTRLADLLAAFDQLDVATEDQIAIIHELKKTGALHAEIIGE